MKPQSYPRIVLVLGPCSPAINDVLDRLDALPLGMAGTDKSLWVWSDRTARPEVGYQFAAKPLLEETGQERSPGCPTGPLSLGNCYGRGRVSWYPVGEAGPTCLSASGPVDG
jgi:hypothetical protein